MLVNDFKEVTDKHLKEKDYILKALQDLLELQQNKNNEQNLQEVKELEDAEMQVQDEKRKLERGLSHLSLDKEHIEKSKIILDEEIEKKTKELTKEKETLCSCRQEVQVLL